ncbi:hypothetical protein B0H19DRAFT_1328010 [Mycena capillaripes]|nr:hypothetical protein B0H19DRAFT_1328010 [Mycena capillaripes]
MTAHKAQGKTLSNCVVNLTGCCGTEAPYVMLSRVTSLQGLVILTPFSKSKITCRRSEDARSEFRRLEYLALKTVTAYGTPAEAAAAALVLARSFPVAAQIGQPEVPGDGADAVRVVNQLQRSNAVLTAPIRLAKLPVTLEGIQQAASLASAGLPTASGSNVRLDSLESVFEVPGSGTMRQRGQPKTRKRKLDDTTMDAESPSTRKQRKS